MSAIFSADKLTLVRGERCLFSNLSFALESGQLLVLEGPNGSGKTSLLKALLGLLELESGKIHWLGEPVAADRNRYRAAVAWLAHRSGFKADLTPVENLRFEASLRPVRSKDIVEVLERLGVLRLKKLPLRALSAGQQRRVALARLLLADASIWLLDEPYTNLDKAGRAIVDDLVREHLGRGGICVMAAHQDVAIDAPTQRVALT